MSKCLYLCMCRFTYAVYVSICTHVHVTYSYWPSRQRLKNTQISSMDCDKTPPCLLYMILNNQMERLL